MHHSVGWRENGTQPKACIMWKFAVVLALLTTPAQAVILDGQILRQNGQGKFVKLDTDKPLVVGFDTFDDDNLYGFDEDQNITFSEENKVKNVTIKKYQSKINDIKNDKIKKSLIELTKVFKQK